MADDFHFRHRYSTDTPGDYVQNATFFDRWLAAHDAEVAIQARADERERIAAAIEAQIIRNAGGHPYNLHSDGLKSAARIARTPDPNGDNT